MHVPEMCNTISSNIPPTLELVTSGGGLFFSGALSELQ